MPVEMTLEALAAQLDQDAAGLRNLDLTAAMRGCALLAKAAIFDNFTGQHDPSGRAWAPLKRQRTGKRHARARAKGGVQQILRDTGVLMASYQGGTGHLEAVRPDGMTVGSNLDRAAWHQFGTRNMVAREQVGWNAALLDECEALILDHLARAMGGP